MKLAQFLETRAGALRENQLHRWFAAAMLLTILLLSLCLVGRDVRVELVPSPLTEAVQLSSTTASRELKLAWGLSLVNLLGNVSPRNAAFLGRTVPTYFTPRVYHAVVTALEAQSRQIVDEQLAVSFVPLSTAWDERRQRVIVSGETTTTGVRGNAQKNLRTYELGFDVRDYRVLVDDFEVYEGAPRAPH